MLPTSLAAVSTTRIYSKDKPNELQVEQPSTETEHNVYFCLSCGLVIKSVNYRELFDNEPLLPDLPNSQICVQRENPTIDPRLIYPVNGLTTSRDLALVAGDLLDTSLPLSELRNSEPIRQVVNPVSPNITTPVITFSAPERHIEEPIETAHTVLASRTSGQGTPHQCHLEGCSRIFPNRRELLRHHNSRKHNPNLVNPSSPTSTTSFQCACGKLHTRRDHHKAHVNNCNNNVFHLYRCNNNHTATNKGEWQNHLENECRPRRGRPPAHLR